MKVKQVKKKKAVKINETKTTKGRLVKLTSVYDELNAYIKTLPEGCEWLFPSRKGDKPITVTQAYRQLNKAAKMVDIEEGIGTHTMRKTFGYFFYKETKDIDSLQKILNHSSVAVTKKYIGITQEEIDKLLENFKL